MSQGNRLVVRRFYHELWNRWDLAVADHIVAEDLAFRGSLGATLVGREAFKGYVLSIQAAFPDWHNRIDEMLSVGDRVVTRMTWTGTHLGRFGEVDATGSSVEYVGAAFFRVSDGLILEAWVVGDGASFWRSLGRLT
jgi:steroid delta-isomerase-like uncharacterized protein